MPSPAIAVLPYGTSLGPRSGGQLLDNLLWPLGQPDALKGGTLADLSREDHVIAYPKTSMHYVPSFGTKAQVSLMFGEPSIIHARHIKLLRLTYRRFFKVMTFSEGLLGRIPNAHFMPYGTTWVPDWESLNTTKTRHMSLIASAKRDTDGHVLRHAMVEFVQRGGWDVEVMGRGYTPFEVKSDGLAPYRFSIVIENVQERNYFSEKLLDAVLCDTVPIYWGCPNLDQFMDTRGVIQCADRAELEHATSAANDALYEDMLPLLQAAKPQAASFGDLERRAAEAVRDAL